MSFDPNKLQTLDEAIDAIDKIAERFSLFATVAWRINDGESNGINAASLLHSPPHDNPFIQAAMVGAVEGQAAAVGHDVVDDLADQAPEGRRKAAHRELRKHQDQMRSHFANRRRPDRASETRFTDRKDSDRG